MYEVTRLSYDLNDVPDTEFERLKTPNGRKSYFRVTLTFHLLIKGDVQFWVTLGGRELKKVTVPYA
jgi:hypothetical protein